ncbi:uncharacterized protein MYCFIDRAFT_183452, partial [Pseudocercospora fijiensis CIRAD86]
LAIKPLSLASYQAIIIRLAKPFDFTSTPDEARTLVYRYYFAANRLVDGAIVVGGKRT